MFYSLLPHREDPEDERGNPDMRTKLFILLVLIASLFAILTPLSYASGPHASGGVQMSPDVNKPSTAGQWTLNGSFVVLFYNDQLGFVHPVSTGMLYHYDSVYGEAITPGVTRSVKVTVEQYDLQNENVTVHSNNVTYSRIESVRTNIQWNNETLVFAHHNETVFQVRLPVSGSEKYVSVNVDGAVFNFMHKSIPPVSIMPFSSSPLETWLLALLFIGIMFVSAMTFAIGTLKKVIYVPPVGVAIWSLVFIGIVGAVVLFMYAYYFELPYIPWFGYLIPVFIVFYFVILEKLSNMKGWTPVKSVYLFGIDDKGGRQEPIAHRKRIYVADFSKRDFRIPDDEQYSGWVKFDPDSRIEALKRLFGRYTPVTWRKGPRPWLMDLGPAQDFRKEDKYLIFTDPRNPKGFNVRETDKWTPVPMKKDTKVRFRKFLRKKGFTERFHIPVSGHHYKHIARFIEGYDTTAQLGDIVDDLDAQVNRLEVLQKISHLRTRMDKNDLIALELAKLLYPGDPDVKDAMKKAEERSNRKPNSGTQGGSEQK